MCVDAAVAIAVVCISFVDGSYGFYLFLENMVLNSFRFPHETAKAGWRKKENCCTDRGIYRATGLANQRAARRRKNENKHQRVHAHSHILSTDRERKDRLFWKTTITTTVTRWQIQPRKDILN